ncbi:MAG: ABC transporter permease [Candidatus Nucleicultricaceae bacterium]
MLTDIILQTLVFLPLVYGVYLSYYILRIPDLTVESSFVSGAVFFTRALEHGLGPVLSFVIGLVGGALVGLMVSLLQAKERIPPLISGILMLFMMYPLNLIFLNRPNVSLLNYGSHYTMSGYPSHMVHLVGAALIVGALTLILCGMLASKIGLTLRAFGVNGRLFQMLGSRSDFYRSFGLILSNMLAGLSGIMTALLNGYTDINMGVGMALVGIGVVIIGHHLEERFGGRSNILQALTFCFFAAFLYFMAMHLCLFFGLNPLYLKIVMAGILILLLMIQPNQIILRRGQS